MVSRFADYGDDWNGNRAIRVKTKFDVTGIDDASSGDSIAADALFSTMISAGGNDEARSDSKHAARVRAPLRVGMTTEMRGQFI